MFCFFEVSRIWHRCLIYIYIYIKYKYIFFLSLFFENGFFWGFQNLSNFNLAEKIRGTLKISEILSVVFLLVTRVEWQAIVLHYTIIILGIKSGAWIKSGSSSKTLDIAAIYRLSWVWVSKVCLFFFCQLFFFLIFLFCICEDRWNFVFGWKSKFNLWVRTRAFFCSIFFFFAF